MKRCAKCGSLIDDEDKFCTYCGAKIEEEKKTYCRNCGIELDPQDRFCPSCGSEVNNGNETHDESANDKNGCDNQGSSYHHEYYGTYDHNGNESVKESPFKSYARFWREYFNFKGRSSVQQFIFPIIFNEIIGYILRNLALRIGGPIMHFDFLFYTFEEGVLYTLVSSIFSLSILIPTIALVVRRLRDCGKSPFYIFLGFIPLVGEIIVFIFCLQRTDKYKM